MSQDPAATSAVALAQIGGRIVDVGGADAATLDAAATTPTTAASGAAIRAGSTGGPWRTGQARDGRDSRSAVHRYRRFTRHAGHHDAGAGHAQPGIARQRG